MSSIEPLLKRLMMILALALAATAEAKDVAIAPGLDPAKALTQYNLDVWTTADELPQNSVNAIVQTRDGYIWLGTERGLVRFDGVQFTVFDKGNLPGLQNSNTQALYEDRAGNLWIGTWGGLHLFKDGRVTSFTTR